jgi:hypothetical protein
LRDKGHRQYYTRRKQGESNTGAVLGRTQHCASSAPICCCVNALLPQIDAFDFGEATGWFSLNIRVTCMKTIGKIRRQHVKYTDKAYYGARHLIVLQKPSKHF